MSRHSAVIAAYVGTTARRPRWARLLVLVVVVVAVVVVGTPAIRDSILKTAGWALIVDDGIESAAVVVVAADAAGAGVLEAVDLVHRGVVSRVAVFADLPDSADREFMRRGVPWDDAAARAAAQFRSLGVVAVEQIPRSVAGTQAETRALGAWCHAHGIRSVIVVTMSDHSRRWRRIVHRTVPRDQTRVLVRPSRYSPFDPDRWWQSRDGVRTAVIELQKLLLDVARHPMS
jgi:hypothetical protein